MNPSAEVSAAAASDSYSNRSHAQVDEKREVTLGGQQFTVFGYKDDPITGFHATTYREVAPPHSIIIAYRGTDPNHPVTTVQDAIVDATMVRDRVNPQEAAASAFTKEMIDKAQNNGISKD